MRDNKELSRQESDKQAATYDTTATKQGSKYPKEAYSYAIDELRREKVSNLLDIGCGTGEAIKMIHEQLPELKMQGIDLSEEMIKAAKEKKIPEAEFTIGDAEDLPFKENSFDAVTCMVSFNHYPNPEKAASEAYRVCKKGGRYILTELYTKSQSKRNLDNLLFFKMSKSGEVHTYSKEELEKLFWKVGFQNVSWRRIGKHMMMITGVKK